MRLPDFAFTEEMTQVFGDGLLAGMRPGFLDAGIESRRRTL